MWLHEKFFYIHLCSVVILITAKLKVIIVVNIIS